MSDDIFSSTLCRRHGEKVWHDQSQTRCQADWPITRPSLIGPGPNFLTVVERGRKKQAEEGGNENSQRIFPPEQLWKRPPLIAVATAFLSQSCYLPSIASAAACVRWQSRIHFPPCFNFIYFLPPCASRRVASPYLTACLRLFIPITSGILGSLSLRCGKSFVVVVFDPRATGGRQRTVEIIVFERCT